MKKSVVVSLSVLLAAASLAWAGRANLFETQVDLSRRVAYGSLYDTRVSADNVQHIGCSLNLIGGSVNLICQATDAGSETLTCQSMNPELVKIAQSISDSSYLYFRCDAANTLTYLYVGNDSIWLQ